MVLGGIKLGIKILLITDVHYSERSEEQEERWFPAKIKKMPKKKIDDYLKYWDGLTQRAFRKLLKKTKSQGPFDFLIDLGDGTAGTNQRGLVTKKAREERQKYDQLIARAFSGIRKYSLYGNHDIGYSDILIQEKVDGRMSRESFDVAEKLIGPPWFSKTIEGFTLLFLNSEIIRSSTEKDNPDQEFFIQKAKEQEKFIQECLKNTSDKIILLIHDPIQLKELEEILEPYKKNIVLILAAHFHMPILWRIYRLHRTMKVIRSFNVKIVPAPWGGIGLPQKIIIGRGGFATLELSNGQFSLKNHKL